MKLKNFYFNYRVLNVILELSVLFLEMIEICFGLHFDNVQLFFVSFVLGIIWARGDHHKFMLK